MLTIILILLITAFLSAVIYIGTTKFWIPLLLKRLNAAIGENQQDTLSNIEQCDLAIEQAFTYIDGLSALDKLTDIEKRIDETEKSLVEEKQSLVAIEKELAESQTSVDEQEKKHNELKKGKEEAEKMADELRANQETLQAEAQRLQDELVASKNHMQSLSTELELTAEQQTAVDKIQASVDGVQSQLKDLCVAYDMSSQRFTNLEVQYKELEKEYRKLVDKELG